MARWTRKYKNRLPDSAFLAISPGGRKDETGRTKPRSLRHLPVKDIRGHVSVSHVKNALARIPLTHITAHQKAEARAKAKKMLARSHILREVEEELLKPYVAHARRRAA